MEELDVLAAQVRASVPCDVDGPECEVRGTWAIRFHGCGHILTCCGPRKEHFEQMWDGMIGDPSRRAQHRGCPEWSHEVTFTRL